MVQTLRISARSQGGSVENDHELLNSFVQIQDTDAFRELVHRHERTVLAACRLVLCEPADIDDAFQATFLVLLKKAKSLDAAAPLGGWLFAVAHRVSPSDFSVRAKATERGPEGCEVLETRSGEVGLKVGMYLRTVRLREVVGVGAYPHPRPGEPRGLKSPAQFQALLQIH
jgi:hypothetical protein